MRLFFRQLDSWTTLESERYSLGLFVDVAHAFQCTHSRGWLHNALRPNDGQSICVHPVFLLMLRYSAKAKTEWIAVSSHSFLLRRCANQFFLVSQKNKTAICVINNTRTSHIWTAEWWGLSYFEIKKLKWHLNISRSDNTSVEQQWVPGFQSC